MKRISLLIFSILIISQVWAEGIHPGVRMVMEASGYKIDSEGNVVSLKGMRVVRFPDENGTNTNPYAYEGNTIYVTNFDVNQWIEKSALSTTGSERARQIVRNLPGDWGTIMRIGGAGQKNGTRIYIQNIPDIFLPKMSGNVEDAFLTYLGTQSFNMADGSSQVFPVFQLLDLYDGIISWAFNAFYAAFDKGIYKEENGYEYSKIKGRTFGRDKATKRELHEWNGNQWIILVEG